MIRAVIFDFGGVIAEEGFREGIKAIARDRDLDPEDFFRIADALIYETGYVKGLTDEKYFWDKLKERTGLKDDYAKLRYEILNRFILREDALDYVDSLRERCLIAAILSDQTNWLDEVNEQFPFYHHFDHIFNSFKIGRGKRDPGTFRYICSLIGIRPEESIFVDDNVNNIKEAKKEGLHSLLFVEFPQMKKEIEGLIGKN